MVRILAFGSSSFVIISDDIRVTFSPFSGKNGIRVVRVVYIPSGNNGFSSGKPYTKSNVSRRDTNFNSCATYLALGVAAELNFLQASLEQLLPKSDALDLRRIPAQFKDGLPPPVTGSQWSPEVLVGIPEYRRYFAASDRLYVDTRVGVECLSITSNQNERVRGERLGARFDRRDYFYKTPDPGELLPYSDADLLMEDSASFRERGGGESRVTGYPTHGVSRPGVSGEFSAFPSGQETRNSNPGCSTSPVSMCVENNGLHFLEALSPVVGGLDTPHTGRSLSVTHRPVKSEAIPLS
jgi:hypothetical protein